MDILEHSDKQTIAKTIAKGEAQPSASQRVTSGMNCVQQS